MGGIVGAGLIVCLFVLTKDLDCHIRLILVLMFYNIAVECRDSGTVLLFQLSGHSDIVRKLCVSWEAEISTRNSEAVDFIVISLKRPPREKLIQMFGETHLKHCEY